jgi:hypothetical protein
MNYLIAYFLLEHFDAPSWYFTLFWGIIVFEIVFTVINGMIKGANQR